MLLAFPEVYLIVVTTRFDLFVSLYLIFFCSARKKVKKLTTGRRKIKRHETWFDVVVIYVCMSSFSLVTPSGSIRVCYTT